MKFSWRPSWICAQNNYFARLDFSRLLVCYSRDLSDHKTIEKASVAICGGFSYIMPYIDWTKRKIAKLPKRVSYCTVLAHNIYYIICTGSDHIFGRVFVLTK